MSVCLIVALYVPPPALVSGRLVDIRRVVIISLSAPLTALCLDSILHHLLMALDKSLFKRKKYDFYVNVCSLTRILVHSHLAYKSKTRALSLFKEFT